MTRGQNDLSIDMAGTESVADQTKRKPLPTKLVIQLASIEEQEEHTTYLESLAKAAKKPPIWSH
jgi:DNA polymerase-3 subunit epsilon